MTKRMLLRIAFQKTVPILVSFLFVSMAYGILITEQGITWYESVLMSLCIYSGSFQFVLSTLLVSGASILTVLVTTVLMNCRLPFYSLSMVDLFKDMGRRKLYMIHTLTDETFAINCALELPERERKDVMFYVAFLSRCAWILGTLVGSIAGQLAPFSLDGIDFCVTAMFVVIAIDQWEKTQRHFSALAGAAAALVCLPVFGADRFILPALLIISAILVLYNSRAHETEAEV